MAIHSKENPSAIEGPAAADEEEYFCITVPATIKMNVEEISPERAKDLIRQLLGDCKWLKAHTIGDGVPFAFKLK
jgi:di/tripeptidase